MNEKVTLKLTAAIAIGGQIHRAGSLVEVDEPTAKNILNRGKGELAEGSDADDDAHDDAADRAAAAEAEQAAIERAMKDQDMTAEQFAALSPAKRKALTKQAADAIAKEAA